MSERVLITSLFLREGDEVDRILTEARLETMHAPLTGGRSHDELVGLLAGVHGVVAGSDPFTAAVLEASPELRVIARTGVGFDAIDVDAATRLGIAVCNAPGVNRQSVAEHTVALMLAWSRRLPRVLADVAGGGWQRPAGVELAGRTLGLVGLGAIGGAVARIAAAIGMDVVAHDPYADAARAQEAGATLVPLSTLLERSDFVSLHVALTEDTRHLIDAERLAIMRDDAVLVNTSRGAIVDQQALLDALEAGTIGGAALDVVDVEPLSAEHPLRHDDRVVLTPHIGGSTMEARHRSGLVAARSVRSALAGERPATLVNASVDLARRR